MAECDKPHGWRAGAESKDTDSLRQKIVPDSSWPSAGDAMRRMTRMTKLLFCFESLAADGAESIEGLVSRLHPPPDTLVIERSPA
ncbi:hypothetical protein GCM10009608_06480 [Pseudonocardia alaniniphila]